MTADTQDTPVVAKSVASKEALFALGPKTMDVLIPELGQGVFIRVRELTGRERDAYDSSLWTERKNKHKLNLEDATAKLVVMSCINEDGTPYFGEDEIGKVSKRLGSKILKRLAEAAKELSGITEEEQEELLGN